MCYNFCGDFDEVLRKDYKKTKLKENGVTFPQFCISVFVTFMERANDEMNVESKKKK